MIYKKSEIDMSLVTCPYEEQEGYVYIEDEYTNNVLRLGGYLDIDEDCFFDLCDRWVFVDKLESYALKSTKCSYWYALVVIDGRFELGEETISSDAHYSCCYAYYVLKDRFELGEPVIATVAEYSNWYACDVLKGRFELGESSIAEDGEFKKEYFNLTGIQL